MVVRVVRQALGRVALAAARLWSTRPFPAGSPPPEDRNLTPSLHVQALLPSSVLGEWFAAVSPSGFTGLASPSSTVQPDSVRPTRRTPMAGAHDTKEPLRPGMFSSSPCVLCLPPRTKGHSHHIHAYKYANLQPGTAPHVGKGEGGREKRGEGKR